jgi:hypothetical protein
MSQPKYTFRCMPTLDMFIDIHANSHDEALEKLRKISEEIINDCCSELYDKGLRECGSDFDFITDAWEYEEDEW